jgi:hypothetical protein
MGAPTCLDKHPYDGARLPEQPDRERKREKAAPFTI